MTFDEEWAAFDPAGAQSPTARALAARFWDLATAAERERIAKLAEQVRAEYEVSGPAQPYGLEVSYEPFAELVRGRSVL